MDVTWLAILASLAMGVGTALIFIFAVKGNYFQHLEDAKSQMFPSELDDMVDEPEKEGGHRKATHDSKRGGGRRSGH